MKEFDRKTIITVHCKDNTRRVIQVIGLWTIFTATSLGRDLEKNNFKFATVSH